MVHFNWLQLIPAVGHHYLHIATFLLAGMLFLVLGLVARSALATGNAVEPAGRFSLRGIFELATEFIVKQSDDVIGKEGRKFVPFHAFLFCFIFLNNLFGLFPGFTPATDNLNTTLAIGLVAFALYNAVGVKQQGVVEYIKHFGGPIWWVAPLLFAIEIISHVFRPFTLGLRLFGNMTGDHTVLGTFLSLVPIGVPVIFYGLGLFVSFVQALVFTLLSMVYVSMAVAHDH